MNQRTKFLLKCQEKRDRIGKYIDKGRGGRPIGYRQTSETKKKIPDANKEYQMQIKATKKSKPRRIKLSDLHGNEFYSDWDKIHDLERL